MRELCAEVVLGGVHEGLQAPQAKVSSMILGASYTAAKVLKEGESHSTCGGVMMRMR